MSKIEHSGVSKLNRPHQLKFFEKSNVTIAKNGKLACSFRFLEKTKMSADTDFVKNVR